MSCTLVKTEDKIKQLGDIVGSSSNIPNLPIEVDTQTSPTEWVIQQLITRLDRASKIVEAEYETYSDKKIEILKNILVDVSQLIQMVEKALNLSSELKLVKQLHHSCDHLADVLTDAVEFRSIASEISVARANPSTDNKKLEVVKNIIERGKKRAKERGNN